MKSQNTISADLVIAALIQAGQIQSTNYNDAGTPPFSAAGTRLLLTNGDIKTPGLFVDGATGALTARGAITTTALIILGLDGAQGATLGASTLAANARALNLFQTAADQIGALKWGNNGNEKTIELESPDAVTAATFSGVTVRRNTVANTAAVEINAGQTGILVNSAAGIGAPDITTPSARNITLAASSTLILQSAAVPVIRGPRPQVQTTGAAVVGELFAASIPQAGCTAALALTNVSTAIPGATLSPNMTRAGIGLFLCTYDFDMSVVGAGACIGELNLNGAVQAQQAIYVPSAAGERATVTQVFANTLNAGVNTVTMQARKSGAGGTANANVTHTTLRILALQ